MPSGARPSWEQVLAECEAAAADAENLLRNKPGFDPAVVAERAAYDLWQLNLPPLPAELHDRARAVHERQLQLQAKLLAAMTILEHQVQLASDGSGHTTPEPIYLDRSA